MDHVTGQRALIARNEMLRLRERGIIALNHLRVALHTNDTETAERANAELDLVDEELHALEHRTFDSTITATQQVSHSFTRLTKALDLATEAFQKFARSWPERVKSHGRRKW